MASQSVAMAEAGLPVSQATILRAIKRAASEGRVCPTNGQLANITGQAKATGAYTIHRLVEMGLIKVETVVHGVGRVITVKSTGQSTAKPVRMSRGAEREASLREMARERPLAPVEPKRCANCNDLFGPRNEESSTTFAARPCCSRNCAIAKSVRENAAKRAAEAVDKPDVPEWPEVDRRFKWPVDRRFEDSAAALRCIGSRERLGFPAIRQSPTGSAGFLCVEGGQASTGHRVGSRSWR